MKCCILTLARMYNGDLNDLIKNLNEYFVKSNSHVDLLVFIEKKDESYINNVIKYLGGDVIYHVIDNFGDSMRFKDEIPNKVFGFSIEYRSMCRFFSGELFKILRQYNYTHYLRLDTDSHFTEPVRDIFKEFTDLNMSYGYITILNDSPEVTLSLTHEIRKYLHRNHINVQQFILNDHLEQLNFVYYNNFEMVKIQEFTNENHLSLYEHLDTINGFMKYRWGDSLFRFIYVNLFIPQDKIYYFANVGYHHKFYLKNQPFRFIDWNIKDYRKQKTIV